MSFNCAQSVNSGYYIDDTTSFYDAGQNYYGDEYDADILKVEKLESPKKPTQKIYDLQKIRRDLNDLHKCGQVSTTCVGSRSLLWRALLEILPVTSDTNQWKDFVQKQRTEYCDLFTAYLSDFD